MLVRREYEEAFDYFDKAKKLIKDTYQQPALLHDIGVAYHNRANSLSEEQKQEREKYFGLASKHFEESTKLDPTYSDPWFSWAYSLYFQGNYQASWSKIKKLRALDESSIPIKFLNDLTSKLPEPNK